MNLPLPEDAELDERLYVASVAKAMRVMETFDQSSQLLSIADITEIRGLGRSATQRFVYTAWAICDAIPRRSSIPFPPRCSGSYTA